MHILHCLVSTHKQIESSIYLINKLENCLKSDYQRDKNFQGAGNTEKQDFEIEEQRNTTIHFIGTSGWVPTGKASIFSCMPKFNEPKTMTIICIWWNYFDMIRNPSPI